MPDDFGLGHMKHYVAINNENSLISYILISYLSSVSSIWPFFASRVL